MHARSIHSAATENTSGCLSHLLLACVYLTQTWLDLVWLVLASISPHTLVVTSWYMYQATDSWTSQHLWPLSCASWWVLCISTCWASPTAPSPSQFAVPSHPTHIAGSCTTCCWTSLLLLLLYLCYCYLLHESSFFIAITNVISDLPLSIIEELKAGSKNYIPLVLCTHKACLNSTWSVDTFNAKIS